MVGKLMTLVIVRLKIWLARRTLKATKRRLLDLETQWAVIKLRRPRPTPDYLRTRQPRASSEIHLLIRS